MKILFIVLILTIQCLKSKKRLGKIGCFLPILKVCCQS